MRYIIWQHLRSNRKALPAFALLCAAFIFLPPGAGRVNADEQTSVSLMRLGADAIEAGEFDKAASFFTQAIEADGLAPEGLAIAYHHRAIAYQRLGRQSDVIADYTKAIDGNALPPAIASRAHYNRGIAHANAGDTLSAEQDYLKAIELAPDYAAAYHNLANLERRRGAYDEAIAHYSAAISHMAGREKKLSLYGRALSHEQKGETDRAVSDLQKALNLDPEFTLADTKLAALTGKEEMAENVAMARVLPATFNPFQAAASGHEDGQLVRISETDGWRTTTAALTEVTSSPAAVQPVSATSSDEIVTGSLHPVTTPKPAQVEKARFRLQLGAFRSAELAEQAWQNAAAHAASVSAAAGHMIERADLGERGIFYRLRTGGFSTIEDARGACKELSARNVDCVVVDG